MSRFIDITVTGDLSHLGYCAEPEKTWERIYSEYCELSGDTQSTRALELAKQITFLTNKINITGLIVNALSIRGRNEELIGELKLMGYRLTFADLPADLQRIISISKTDQMKLTAGKEQYTKLDMGEKTTKFQWYQILSAIAKHRDVVSINPANITVIEYIAMDKEMREYIVMMNRANKR